MCRVYVVCVSVWGSNYVCCVSVYVCVSVHMCVSVCDCVCVSVWVGGYVGPTCTCTIMTGPTFSWWILPNRSYRSRFATCRRSRLYRPASTSTDPVQVPVQWSPLNLSRYIHCRPFFKLCGTLRVVETKMFLGIRLNYDGFEISQ